MNEALDILWTYARRQPIDCNGKVVIPSINQSIAAIRLIIRLEEAKKRDERKSKSEEQKTMRKEQRMMGEEQSVMSVTDYTPFEEEEEEEVSPFAPFLLDEDEWSLSADNQLPKETPLSHEDKSTFPSFVPTAKAPYPEQLKSFAKKYFEKYMKPKLFPNGKCQQTTSYNRLYDGFPTKKQHPTLHDPYLRVIQTDLLSNVRPPPKSFKPAESNQ